MIFLDKNYSPEEFYARLNINLEILELFENIEKTNDQNRQKDKIIQEQNKMTSMAELIKNISHHWRQPLNAISTSADGLKLDFQLDMLNVDEIPEKMNDIIKTTQFLSQTIDTFRDIISEKSESTELILQEQIERVINVQRPSLEEKNIEIKTTLENYEPIKLSMPVGKLNKVLIYIINNAYDVLEKSTQNEKWIDISLNKKDNKVLINIEDNGGGIPNDIIENIFEPYFTTKHQSQGTGLGLHNAISIVTKVLNGKLYAANTSNGAKFTIELPL